MIRKMPRASAAAHLAAALVVASPLAAPPGLTVPSASAQSSTKRSTDLPLPRFVSLKSAKVNVRRGPGEDYEIVFVFLRAGLPVEIIQEFDNWRKIRDSEGQEGWVFHSLLSGERTALVTPWQGEGQTAAHRTADPAAAVSAYLEPRVVTEVAECTGDWCRIEGKGYGGWVEQEKLWGVYPGEQIDD